MAGQTFTPETRLLFAAQQALLQRSDAGLTALRRAAAAAPTPGAGPAWVLLRGAADAHARTGDRHPLREEIARFLSAAIELAVREGQPPAPPVYRGGGLRHFERPDQ